MGATRGTKSPYYPLWKVEGKVRNLKTAVELGYMNVSGQTFTAPFEDAETEVQGG